MVGWSDGAEEDWRWRDVAMSYSTALKRNGQEEKEEGRIDRQEGTHSMLVLERPDEIKVH